MRLRKDQEREREREEESEREDGMKHSRQTYGQTTVFNPRVLAVIYQKIEEICIRHETAVLETRNVPCRSPDRRRTYLPVGTGSVSCVVSNQQLTGVYMTPPTPPPSPFDLAGAYARFGRFQTRQTAIIIT